jgi:hypothetical protein
MKEETSLAGLGRFNGMRHDQSGISPVLMQNAVQMEHRQLQEAQKKEVAMYKRRSIHMVDCSGDSCSCNKHIGISLP